MSELSDYYHNVACVPSTWGSHEEERCGCGGRGWWLSQVDTWHQCPYHGKGVPHPEDRCEDTSIPAEEGEFVMRTHITYSVPEVPTWSSEDDLPF